MITENMKNIAGQWIGPTTGEFSGTAVLDLDDEGNHYVGSGLIFFADPEVAGTRAIIHVPKDIPQEFDAPIFPLDGRGNELSQEQLRQLYPNIQHGTSSRISFQRDDDVLTFKYKTNIGTQGEGHLRKGNGDAPSVLTPETEVKSWEDFKQYVSKLEIEKFLFRGQPAPYRLRTSFHRTNRTDLARYMDEDAIILKRDLSPLLHNQFNFDIPEQLGSFFNLAQHHGYPTPLLDWTESPFVAAFFAFRRASKHPSGKVRIFMFEHRAWTSNVRTDVHVSRVLPHLTVMALSGALNNRMLPQQAISTLTNVDDIESMIQFAEGNTGLTFLRVFDLPASERDQVISELRVMGITAASLFPGLDGSCEALSHRRFKL